MVWDQNKKALSGTRLLRGHLNLRVGWWECCGESTPGPCSNPPRPVYSKELRWFLPPASARCQYESWACSEKTGGPAKPIRDRNTPRIGLLTPPARANPSHRAQIRLVFGKAIVAPHSIRCTDPSHSEGLRDRDQEWISSQARRSVSCTDSQRLSV